jgi:enoyl-CoA hydratase
MITIIRRNNAWRKIIEQKSFSILVDTQPNGVYTLHFDNEKKLNPMTVAMGEKFEETMTKLASDKKIRCLVLTGKGKAFSAGGDLNFLKDRTKDTPYNNSKIMRAFYRRFLSLRNLPVPVISAINGPAIGAGFCVALATDIRVANPKAKMGLNFVKIGLHPGMAATHFLPQIVGTQGKYMFKPSCFLHRSSLFYHNIFSFMI